MTATEYWDGDCELVRAYRKAQQLRDEREDALAWLQGRYIYDALCMVSPLYHDFVRGKPKAAPYSEKPYMEIAKERQKAESKDARKRNGLAHMIAYAERFGKQKRAKEAAQKDAGGELK